MLLESLILIFQSMMFCLVLIFIVHLTNMVEMVAGKSLIPHLTNIYNPVSSYGIPQFAFDAAFLTPGDTFGTTGNLGNRAVIYNSWYGAYFQDHITLWDKLHIMGGGRYDWAETGRGNGFSFDEAASRVDGLTRKDEGFSPRIGVLFQPIKELGIYANYTTFSEPTTHQLRMEKL